MGIPTLFRELLQNHTEYVTPVKKNPDYFFLDFNSFIYRIFYQKPFLSQRQLIHDVVIELYSLIHEIAPTKMLYVAVDGTCPRAKMVQQRSRRYKALQLEQLKRSYMEHYNIRERSNAGWNPSHHICPGTDFMINLNQSLLKMLQRNFEHIPVRIFDSCQRPGEGEHKILPHIKKLTKVDPDGSVMVFSPDNDIISLSLVTQKKNIFILRYCDGENDSFVKKMAKLGAEEKMFVFDINLLRQNLLSVFPGEDEVNIVLDFNFLLAMVGNDFVPSLPFLKIKNGGLTLLKKLYTNTKSKHPGYGYLIEKETFRINLPFFKDIVRGLSLMEDTEMKRLQYFISKEKNSQSLPAESFENFYTTLQHGYICNANHPLYETYARDFEKIDYSLDKHEWKSFYYEHFLEVDSKNFSVYNALRTKVVREYLKSLMFTLYYYNKECPSWTWYYPYRMPPIFQDVFTVLEKHNFDLNKIVFDKGQIMSPFQQLSMILPPQNFKLLPNSFSVLLNEYKEYFPYEFKIEATLGLKYIYSEAHLPDFENLKAFMRKIRYLEQKLSVRDRKRNVIIQKIYKF